jgi:hypothetical protein
MITPEQWKEIEKQANKLYTNLELEIIQEIAERIANVGYANTVVLNDILIAEEMGLMYQDIIRLVAKYNETSVSQIKDIFETAGVKSLEYDDKIYKLAGLNPSSLKQSTSMWQLLGATALKTHNNLSNLVMTTANTSQTQFYDAMNKAYMEVSTGVKSYSQSIIDTIKDISNQGTYITYPSGRNMSIESAVRMNIVTSVNQTCGKLQEMRAEEMGWDLMELTAHAGARPEHAEWQGKIVSRSGQKGYLSLNDIGYGEVTGFKGVNCRHDWSPYLKGLSLTYTNKELEKMKDAKVTYNGKQISQYDAEQMQRKMERRIRQDKKDIAGLQGILTSGNKDDKLLEDTRIQLANAQTKLRQDNSILNNFTKQTGLRKDSTRITVGNIKQASTSSLQVNKINTITVNNLFEKLDINPKDYIPFGKYDPFDNNIQERTAELLGMDNLPKLVNKKAYLESKGTEIIRVVHSYHGKTAKEAYENTIRGKIQYSENTNSSFGRGIYFGDKSVEHSILSFYSGKTGDSQIINAKIDKSAKILEFNNQIEYLKDVNSRILKLPDDLKKIYEKETSLLYMLDGIDGIKIKTNQYYCIYNRGVLIINE